MASQGYVPGFVFHPDQGMRRLSQDYQPLLLSFESSQDVIRPGWLAMRSHGLQQSEQTWKSTSGLSDSNQFVSNDSSIRRPVLIDVQDTRPNSILFSFGIAKQYTKQWEILEFLHSGSSEVERGGLNLSILTDLMGLQAMPTEISQHPFASDYQLGFHNAESQLTIFYPSSEFYFDKPLSDLVGNLAHKSEFMVHLDDQVAFAGARTEMKYILSIIAEFYLSKNSTKWRKQSLLVPQFDSLQKTGLRPSPKKRTNRKAGKERELYRKNYFHSCESLLSIMVDKKRHGKTAILELKKSGPELTELLIQFSASIAGTGLALVFTVVNKVASGRVPFCASKLLNVGLGLGLVWLSWAVNKLRNTIIHISKNSSKWVVKEEELMKDLDRSVKEVYVRAATLMVVMVLRLA